MTMCLSCGCGTGSDHGDPAHITLPVLEKAAEAAGVSALQAAENIVLTLNKAIHKTLWLPEDIASTVEYRVVKSGSERRFTLGVAYPAMKADMGRAADGHRDFVSAEALEKTAHEWLAKFRDVSIFHKEGTSGHFTPAESYLWPAPDWVTVSPVDGKEYRVCKGDWLLGGYWDDYGWSLVKTRLINGWSPEGGARRSVPSPARLASLRS
jgi:hypothetical protein